MGVRAGWHDGIHGHLMVLEVLEVLLLVMLLVVVRVLLLLVLLVLRVRDEVAVMSVLRAGVRL